MRRYRHGLVVAAALAAVVRTPSVWAGESSPAEQLKAEIDRVVKTLEDPALQGDARGAERRAADPADQEPAGEQAAGHQVQLDRRTPGKRGDRLDGTVAPATQGVEHIAQGLGHAGGL